MESISCEAFNKTGDFFSLEICSCAMGGYYTSDLYLFKEIVHADSLNYIPFWCCDGEKRDYDSITNENISWEYFGKIKKLEHDTLIINYFPRGYIWVVGEDDRKVIEKEPFDILYIYKDNQWRIANKEDYEKFDITCFDMNFNFRY